MASASASTHPKDKTTSISSSYTSSDELRRRRAAKTFVWGSPQRETNPLQHKPFVRSTSDSAAKVSRATPLQTHIAATNKSHPPGIARKLAEKPSSPSSPPLKSSSTASATAKEKTPRPSSSVSRVAASSKPARVSEKTTRALRAGGGGAISSAKSQNPATSVVSHKKKLSTSDADSDRRALSKDPSVKADEDYLVVPSPESHASGENNHIEGMEAESIEAKEETLAETNEATEEEDTNLESQPKEQHDSPEHELYGNIDNDGNRVPELANEQLSEESSSIGFIEPPREEPCEVAKVEAEAEGANLVMPDPCDAMPENREDDADQETSSNKSPAAESTVEKIAVREAQGSKATAPAPAETRTATLVENGGETAVTARVFKKPTLLQVKKKEKVSNDAIEETRSKLLEKKKSKVRALVGAFETVISLQDESQPDKNQGSNFSKESTEWT